MATTGRKKGELGTEEVTHEDGQRVFIDPIGVSFYLPPRKCESCAD